MHSSQILSILAFTSTTLALPQWGSWGSGKPQGNWDGHDSAPEATVTAIATATAYTTVVYGGQNWGGHAKPTEAPAAPVASTVPDTSSWSSWSAPAAPAASSAPSTGGSSSGGYMAVVNEWRSKMGHSTLTEDSQLQANALKTVQDGNGQMVHELNPGSMAQVLAPGSADDFTSVYVGGWLCEVPSAAGLDGICNTESAGWSYEGQTGHADILNSADYSKIGCAIADGIWGCDLA